MLFKVILVFLLAMVLVGMIGKVVFPNGLDRAARRKATICPNCKRPLIGKNCDCKGRK
ncbi:MAG: hypothetical protein WAT09_01420 [Paracoccaceae bacterium]